MTDTRALLLLAIFTCGPILAAVPPELVNYQGVLRDASDDALDGSFEMRFRFYDSAGGAPPCPAAGGTLLLTDEHLAAGTGGVIVTGGLFNVALGSGNVVAGAATSPEQVFRDNAAVWLELEIAGEVLCPRTRVLASAYALNASSLGGVASAGFLRSDTADTFSGTGLTFSTGPAPDLVLVEDGFRLNTAIDEFLFLQNDGAGLINLSIDGNLFVGAGSDSDSDQIRFDGFFGNEHITWFDTVHRFHISDDLSLAGALRTGSGGGGSTQAYNVMKSGTGTPFPDSGLMADASDLYVEGDVEIEGIGVLAGQLRMLDAGPDQDQQIHFFDAGSATDESLRWDEADDRFELSDSFALVESGAQLLTNDGSTAAPGLSFVSAPNTGFYRGVNRITHTVNGVDQFTVFDNGDTVSEGRLFVYGLEINLGPDTVLEVEPSSFNDVMLSKDRDNDNGSWFRIFEDNTFEQMRIQDGDEASALFDGTVSSNGLDYAEAFKVLEGSGIEAGDVVGPDPARPEFVVRTAASYDTTAIGVVSARPGYLTGMSFEAEDDADPELRKLRDAARERGELEQARAITAQLAGKAKEMYRAVALVGRVPVKVVATGGAIRAGDRLTTSDVPGHAMRMTEPGPSIGIALENWSSAEPGRVLTFIQPGWFGGTTSTSRAVAPAESVAESVAPGTATASGTAVISTFEQRSAAHEVRLGRDADGRLRFSVVRSQGEGQPRSELFRVNHNGDVFAKGAFRPAATDVAEYFPLSEPVEPGDVLAIDLDHPGRFRRAAEASDPKVVGIVSLEPGMLLGSGVERIMTADDALAARLQEARDVGDGEEEARLWQELERRFLESHAPIAMTGTVSVKANAGYGEIRPGDLLTSSPTPGHAMRADDPQPGTILGKALEPLDVGTGLIKILVTLR